MYAKGTDITEAGVSTNIIYQKIIIQSWIFFLSYLMLIILSSQGFPFQWQEHCLVLGIIQSTCIILPQYSKHDKVVPSVYLFCVC